MQIVFIPEKTQVNKFLSGLQAEAKMPVDTVEVSGMSEDQLVTVICSGLSTHYHGTITGINSNYQTPGKEGKWLGITFLVERTDP